jgi:hypothetical protein
MRAMKTLLFAACLLASACNGSSRCTPGQSIACACVGGGTGAQICQTDGTYALCDCSTPLPIPFGPTDGGNVLQILDLAGTTSPGNKRFFTTSAEYPPTLGGLIGADRLCNTIAAGANLNGHFIAWLSDQSTNAIDRVADVGPWFLLDGTRIFNNKANLAGSALAAPNVDENKGHVSGSFNAWTGTNTGGQSSNVTCYNWSVDTTEGSQGEIDSALAWTQSATANCASSAHLYCIEQQ